MEQKEEQIEVNGQKYLTDFELYLKMREYDEKKEQEAFLHWYGPKMGPMLWAMLKG